MNQLRPTRAAPPPHPAITHLFDTVCVGHCNTFGGIHPRNKTELGRRLALRLAELEGVAPNGTADGPLFSRFTPIPGGGTITYTNAAGALALRPTLDCVSVGGLPAPLNASDANCCQSMGPSGAFGFPFQLRAKNGGHVPALAAINGTTVTLTPLATSAVNQAQRAGSIDMVRPFIGFRYAWSAFPLCLLFNGAGLPAAPVM